MIIRILGLLVGLAFVSMTFFGLVDRADPRTWIGLFMGVAFIAYGIGGQRGLSKVAPAWAKRLGKEQS
jgi:hypothetical protein